MLVFAEEGVTYFCYHSYAISVVNSFGQEVSFSILDFTAP